MIQRRKLLTIMKCQSINGHNYVFVISWLIGLLFGLAVAFHAPQSTASLMRSHMVSRVSIVWVLFLATLPYFMFYLLPGIGSYALSVYIFIRAWCYSYCICVISHAFGSADWLMCLLCLFADIGSLTILLWFLLRSSCLFSISNIQEICMQFMLCSHAKNSSILFHLP